MKLSQSQRSELKKALETLRKKMPADLIAECENHILNEGNIDPSHELLNFIQDYQNQAQRNYDLTKRMIDELNSYDPGKDLEKRRVEARNKTEPPFLKAEPPFLKSERNEVKKPREEKWAMYAISIFIGLLVFFIFILSLIPKKN
jgi:hypothetical protein